MTTTPDFLNPATIADLLKIVEAATQRKWVSNQQGEHQDQHARAVWSEETLDEDVKDILICTFNDSMFEDCKPDWRGINANAQHIATFDPPTVRALLSTLQSLQQTVARLPFIIECGGTPIIACKSRKRAEQLAEGGRNGTPEELSRTIRVYDARTAASTHAGEGKATDA